MIQPAHLHSLIRMITWFHETFDRKVVSYSLITRQNLMQLLVGCDSHSVDDALHALCRKQLHMKAFPLRKLAHAVYREFFLKQKLKISSEKF